MRAYVCDRCKKIFWYDEEHEKKYSKVIVELDASKLNGNRYRRDVCGYNSYDLCHDCAKSLDDWLLFGRGKEEGDGERQS